MTKYKQTKNNHPHSIIFGLWCTHMATCGQKGNVKDYKLQKAKCRTQPHRSNTGPKLIPNLCLYNTILLLKFYSSQSLSVSCAQVYMPRNAAEHVSGRLYQSSRAAVKNKITLIPQYFNSLLHMLQVILI